MIAIDHVLYAVDDLDAAADRFARAYGLASYPGGTHPAFGTGNRIVPLGESYIELIGVVDRNVAEGNPLGRVVAAAAADGDRWLGWVVGTDDLDTHAARLGLTVVPGQRARPDGSMVSWRAAGMEQIVLDPSLPFFIAWDDRTAHPGRVSVEHPQPASEIAWIEVGGDHEGLRRWLGGAELPIRALSGRAGVLGVGIRRSDRTVISIG